MDQLKTQIMGLPAEEWQDLLAWVVSTEKHRRDALPAVEAARADLVTELQDAGKLEKPDVATVEQAREQPDAVPAWENPLTDHARMYHSGAVVTHNERVWQSTHPGLNHWEPGAHGVDERIWADITDRVKGTEPEENTAGAVIPFGPGLPVQEGDIIEYEGQRYRVLSAHTTASHWPPDQAHSLFQRL